jgi:hypothetical protein
MNSGSLKRAIGLVLIYIGVFIAIVVIQFGRSPGFLARSGRLSVSAAWTSSDRKGPPASVKIQYAGLIFDLSPSHPALVQHGDGSTTKAMPLSVEKVAGGALIRLSGGGELRAVADTASLAGFRLSATRPGADASALVLSYDLAGGARLSDASRVLVLQASGGPFSVSFASSTLDTDAGKLSLSFDTDTALSSLDLRRIAPPPATGQAAATTAGAAKSLPQSPMDPAAYKAIIAGWSDKVWRGLSSGRWDGDSLGWKGSSATPSFSESALAAYLAEAATRSAFADALARMRQAAKRYASSLTYFSTPFLGDTIDHMEAREGQDAEEGRRLAGLLQSKDPSILRKDDIVHFLIDRVASAQAQETLRFFAGVDPSQLGLADALGYLAAANEARSYLADGESPFKAADAAATRILARVIKAQEGWFLKSGDDGSVDIRLSLRAGMALSDWGNASGKDSLVAAGQALVSAALGLADENGLLPATILPKAAGPSEFQGTLVPEDCYDVVIANPYYPHERSFYRELGAGVWAWTCSPSITVSPSSASAVFSVSFPTGFAHYMAIYGLKPFANIKLYGINYSPDAAFESYEVSGYLFRKASNALYLKMKHKQDVEKIELYY